MAKEDRSVNVGMIEEGGDGGSEIVDGVATVGLAGQPKAGQVESHDAIPLRVEGWSHIFEMSQICAETMDEDQGRPR